MDGVDAQDVAMQYMMHGREGLFKLYTESPVPPEVSAEAWATLHANDRTGDDLAVFLASVHLPIRACRAPTMASANDPHPAITPMA